MEHSIKKSGIPSIGSLRNEMFKTANEFSLYIEQIVRDKKMTYMDAVLEYCKENY